MKFTKVMGARSWTDQWLSLSRNRPNNEQNSLVTEEGGGGSTVSFLGSSSERSQTHYQTQGQSRAQPKSGAGSREQKPSHSGNGCPNSQEPHIRSSAALPFPPSIPLSLDGESFFFHQQTRHRSHSLNDHHRRSRSHHHSNHHQHHHLHQNHCESLSSSPRQPAGHHPAHPSLGSHPSSHPGHHPHPVHPHPSHQLLHLQDPLLQETSEVSRSFIRAPPNRTVFDCCCDCKSLKMSATSSKSDPKFVVTLVDEDEEGDDDGDRDGEGEGEEETEEEEEEELPPYSPPSYSERLEGSTGGVRTDPVDRPDTRNNSPQNPNPGKPPNRLK